MRTIEIDLAAGGTALRALTGRYIRVIDAAASFLMQLDESTDFYLEKGIGVHWDEGFSTVSVYSATAQTITLAVSNYRVDDSRFNLSGAVSVVDGGLTRVKNNTAFMTARGQGAVAGQYSASQIINDAANSVRLIVTQIALSTTAATFVGGGYAVGAIGFSQVLGVSKLLNAGLPSVGQGACRAASQAGPYGYQAMFSTYATATAAIFKFTEPLILLPGDDFIFSPNTQNVGIYVNYEWLEEAI